MCGGRWEGRSKTDLLQRYFELINVFLLLFLPLNRQHRGYPTKPTYLWDLPIFLLTKTSKNSLLRKMAPTMVAVAPLVALALVTLLFAKYYFSPAPSRPTRSVVLLVLGDMG